MGNNPKVWFTSDPHYGHSNVLGFCKRPFKDIDEMNEELIRRYNSKVGKNDIVYWLGDCFFCNAPVAKDIMSRLNGVKICILGNHDRGTVGMIGLGFTAVLRSAKIEIGGKVCLLSHYPWEPSFIHTIRLMIKKIKIRYVDRAPQKAVLDRLWCLHGHTHSKKKMDRERKLIHVGVDAHNFYPVSMSEIESMMKRKEIHDKKHEGATK